MCKSTNVQSTNVQSTNVKSYTCEKYTCAKVQVFTELRKNCQELWHVHIRRQNLTDFLCLRANFVYLVCNDICGRLVKYPRALGPFHTQPRRIDFYRIGHNGIMEKRKKGRKKRYRNVMTCPTHSSLK